MGFYHGMKFVHFGGNLLWPFLYFIAEKDVNIFITIIADYHALSVMMAYFGMVTIWIFGKSNTSKKLWNLLVISNIIGLIICYLLALLGSVGK